MKETPLEQKIVERMQPGVITLSGFLGNDKRHLHEIIDSDKKAIEATGHSIEEIVERMQYFTDQSWNSYEFPIELEGKYLVETDVIRGRLACPFMHRGVYRKAITTLFNKSNNIAVRWTSLTIHLIKEHHFFEGKGSPFRLEPADLVKALF